MEKVKDQGIKALLLLTDTILKDFDSTKPESLMSSVGRAQGVLRYIQDSVLGLEKDNEQLQKAQLQGSELALIFASNFDLKVPGIWYISLHSEDPHENAAEMLDARERTFMIDMEGDGEMVNVTTIEFSIPSGMVRKLSHIGLWDEAEGGTLYDAGELHAALELSGPRTLTLSPGGLKVQLDASEQ
jgi:hypothetical protein